MERHYAVLQKKLDELEALLQVLLSHPSGEAPCEPPCHHPDHQEIQARLGFLKNLLASEMEVNAESTPDQLHEISDRLTALEEVYHNWIDSMALPDGHHDTLSSCSCTSSCVNEVEQEDLHLVDEDALHSHKREEDIGEEKTYYEKQAVAEEDKYEETAAAKEEEDETSENDGRGQTCGEMETLKPGYSLPLAPLKDVKILCSYTNKVDKGREMKHHHHFKGRKCGVIGTVVLVTAVVIIATKFWSVEEAVYLVPT